MELFALFSPSPGKAQVILTGIKSHLQLSEDKHHKNALASEISYKLQPKVEVHPLPLLPQAGLF